METLRYVVLVNGLLAVVSIAFYVLLRRETFFGANRLALWLGLTASFVLPLLELPDWRPQPVKVAMQRTARVIVPKVLPSQLTPQPDVTITFPNGRTYPAFRDRVVRSGWSWQQGVLGLYVAVLLFLLVRFMLRLRSLMRLIRQSVQEPYEGFTLVTNASVTSPFSFFGWVVLNPDHHAPDELEQILRHERVHVRERHSFDMIAAELVSIIFWFNPAASLFRQLVHQTLEFSADRAVLAEGIDPTSYQYHLVKVSLSAGQSAITNHFSRSALKSRIVMLNKPNSAPTTWLKYPVLCIAVLTMVSTFARPQLKTLKKYVPAPVAQVVATAIDTKPANMPAQEIAIVPTQLKIAPKQMSTLDVAISADTALQSTVANISSPTLKSPSRYMQYEGDKLYWVITPKTSFDDLAIMKQEFDRHGYKMQIQALRYDPLNTYITEIKVTIIRPVVGTSDFEETSIDGKPIRSHGGFNGLNELKNVAAVGSILPQGLVQMAREEELSVTKFIHHNRMKYLIATGTKLSSKYGSGTTNIANVNAMLARPDLIRKYGIRLNADSTFDISDAYLPLFINNEPVTNTVLKRVHSKHFSTLMISEEYGQNGQSGAVNALLFYTKEP